jgi:putative nucleotidyltransferase with HDIG domain
MTHSRNSKEFCILKEKIVTWLLAEKEKEFHCHIKFVSDIGIQLAEEHDVSPALIEIACLLHDIGRDAELEGEDHGDAGARISATILLDSEFTHEEQNLILRCIKNHCKELPEEDLTMEEKITITADSASKVLFHEAFMLMCKKPTYAEKLAWGQKYLKKGYFKILFPAYKDQIQDRYHTIRDIYDAVLDKSRSPA